MEAKKNGKEPQMNPSNYLSHSMCYQQNRQLNGKGSVNNYALLHQALGVRNPATGLALINASFPSQRFINFNLFPHNIFKVEDRTMMSTELDYFET